MPSTTSGTAEDRSNVMDDANTFGKGSLDPVKVAHDQAYFAFTHRNQVTPLIERSGNDSGWNPNPLRTATVEQEQQEEWPVNREKRPLIPTFHALQEWEGYVVSIGKTEFTARLVDLTEGRAIEDEEARIPLEEISESDAAKMKTGSIFRWVIGYKRLPMGQKERVSSIVFRDLPAVTKSDWQRGEVWADQFLEFLQE